MASLFTPPTERHTHEGVDEWLSGRDSARTSQSELETEKLGAMSVRAWGSTFYSPSDKDGYVRPSLSYDVTDQWKITVGANILWGMTITRSSVRIKKPECLLPGEV